MLLSCFKDPSLRPLAVNWSAAMGLQDVDGMEPSPFLQKLARETLEGTLSLDAAQQQLTRYYQSWLHKKESIQRFREADFAALRIVMLLQDRRFTFSPDQLLSIHRQLFSGILPHAGQIRDYNITKEEWVLQGETVFYAPCETIARSLQNLFTWERQFSCQGLSRQDYIRHLAEFTAHLWQIHAFGEGNTRTTALFLMKYLEARGFRLCKQVFMKNAWYFRNALVRANFRNPMLGVENDRVYLENFLDTLLYGTPHTMKNEHLHIGYGHP